MAVLEAERETYAAFGEIVDGMYEKIGRLPLLAPASKAIAALVSGCDVAKTALEGPLKDKRFLAREAVEDAVNALLAAGVSPLMIALAFDAAEVETDATAPLHTTLRPPQINCMAIWTHTVDELIERFLKQSATTRLREAQASVQKFSAWRTAPSKAPNVAKAMTALRAALIDYETVSGEFEFNGRQLTGDRVIPLPYPYLLQTLMIGSVKAFFVRATDVISSEVSRLESLKGERLVSAAEQTMQRAAAQKLSDERKAKNALRPGLIDLADIFTKFFAGTVLTRNLLCNTSLIDVTDAFAKLSRGENGHAFVAIVGSDASSALGKLYDPLNLLLGQVAASIVALIVSIIVCDIMDAPFLGFIVLTGIFWVVIGKYCKHLHAERKNTLAIYFARVQQALA